MFSASKFFLLLLFLLGGLLGFLLGGQTKQVSPEVALPKSLQEKEFARGLAEETGLQLPVVLAWMRVEGGQPGNWLNIDADFSTDPETAGRQAGRWMSNASPGIQKIASSAGKTRKQQIATIADSGWSAFDRYGELLQAAGQKGCPRALDNSSPV